MAERSLATHNSLTSSIVSVTLSGKQSLSLRLYTQLSNRQLPCASFGVPCLRRIPCRKALLVTFSIISFIIISFILASSSPAPPLNLGRCLFWAFSSLECCLLGKCSSASSSELSVRSFWAFSCLENCPIFIHKC